MFAAVLAVSMVLAVLCTWFGPAGRTARDGARRILNNLAPGLVGAAVVVLVCLVGAWLLMGAIFTEPHEIHWWPMDGPPSFF